MKITKAEVGDSIFLACGKDGEVEKLRVVDKIWFRDGKFFRVNQWNGIID